MFLYIVVILLTLIALYKFYGGTSNKFSSNASPRDDLNQVQELFFRTVFTLLGYVAKRDGPINKEEVRRTQTYMEKMELGASQKREAIRLFKVGAEPHFHPEQIISDFYSLAQERPNLAQILLVYLITLAGVDGSLAKEEVDAVQKVATGLGYSNIMFKHLLQMVSSQYKFGKISGKADESASQKSQTGAEAQDASSRWAEDGNSQGKAKQRKDSTEKSGASCAEKTEAFNTRDDQLGAAYEVFDVPANSSDADIKKAYRSLVSQYHPDKLMGQGLPPYMIQSATECFKTIQAAYAYIKSARAKQAL